jgi:hypothetical protein
MLTSKVSKMPMHGWLTPSVAGHGPPNCAIFLVIYNRPSKKLDPPFQPMHNRRLRLKECEGSAQMEAM